MINCYRISRVNIVNALKEMKPSSDFHIPKVVRVDPDGENYLVFVECDSNYPCREAKWHEMGPL